MTFVGHKQNKQWLIYAYHRETGEIVAGKYLHE
jgi:insertion element IS1 protein InsB